MEQADFNGEKGINIKNDSPPSDSKIQTRVGQYVTGLEVGKRYTFSVDIKSSVDTSYTAILRAKKITGSVSGDGTSAWYPSNNRWVKLAANKWRTLSFSFVAKETTFWFHASFLKGNTGMITSLKKPRLVETDNLVDDPAFSTFGQEEQNSWVYAINGGKNANFNHMPLTPSQGGGYDIPDGAGNPTVGHVDQADFNGEKGINIKNDVTAQDSGIQTRVGQYMTGLEIGKRYTFSVDIKSNVDTSYMAILRAKKVTGSVSGDGTSTWYPSNNAWTKLIANKWRTLSFSFVAEETTFWFHASFSKGNTGMVTSLKKPRLAKTDNLVDDPAFSTFGQEEQRGWTYAVNGGKNINYVHMPLTASQKGGYDIPDGAGNPTVGYVDQADFNGEKGVSITNNATPLDLHHQTRLGQYVTGLEVGKNYVFSVDIKSSVNTTYMAILRSKKTAGVVSGDGASTWYPSTNTWTNLAANEWKKITYTFTAHDTSLWFHFSFQQGSIGMVTSIKSPQLYEVNNPPDLNLNQSDFSVGEGEAVTIKGQAWDSDTSSFKVALIDKSTGAVLHEQPFEGISWNEKKDFTFTLPANQLKLGKNEFIARVTDKWGAKKELPITVTVGGVLNFTEVPATLPFENTEITSQSKIIKRQDANWQIKIDNSAGKNWQVKAEATPAQDESGKPYPNALVFTNESGATSDLADGQQVIASGDGTNTSPVISWSADKGILFRYSSGTMKVGRYQSTVTFTLEDTPPLK